MSDSSDSLGGDSDNAYKGNRRKRKFGHNEFDEDEDDYQPKSSYTQFVDFKKKQDSSTDDDSSADSGSDDDEIDRTIDHNIDESEIELPASLDLGAKKPPKQEYTKHFDELKNIEFASSKKVNGVRSSSSKLFNTKKPNKTSSANPLAALSRAENVDKDFAKFQSHGKGFGLKMMLKMGYKVGQGLGEEGAGIVNPIDVKLRPGKMGLGHNGFDERTEAIKLEQRRKRREQGLESDEEKPKGKKSTKPPKQQWKKATSRKQKFRTAAQLIQDQGGASIHQTTAQMKILDMTGKTPQELSNISETPLFHHKRLPELLHNLTLIVDTSAALVLDTSKTLNVDAHEIEVIQTKEHELTQLNYKNERKIKRLDELVSLFRTFEERINQTEASSLDDVFEKFSDIFTTLIQSYGDEFTEHDLDALVVGGIAGYYRNFVRDWNVFGDPGYCVDVFRKWKGLLIKDNFVGEDMSAWESLLYHVWLPRVRSAVNTDWDVKRPNSMIELLELWHPALEYSSTQSPKETRYATPTCLIPFWLYTNIIDQLLLPKIKRSIQNWDAKTDPTPIHVWLHPWLMVIDGDKLDTELFEDVRFKLGLVLNAWHPRDVGALEVLKPWKDVFSKSTMESFLTRHIIPKLILILRNEFQISPINQTDLHMLTDWIFPWRELIPDTLFGYMFSQEFFNVKWLTALHRWCSSSSADFAEISGWYTGWKSVFKNAGLDELNPVKEGFKIGLQIIKGGMAGSLMSLDALIDGKSATTKLEKKIVTGGMMTFKDMVEQTAHANELYMIPLGISHAGTGKALFKIVKDDGKKSSKKSAAVVYIDEDVLFMEVKNPGGSDWVPISIDEVMEKVKDKH